MVIETDYKEILIRMIPKQGFFFNKGLLSYDKSTTTFGVEISRDGRYKTGLTPKEQAEFEKELGLKEGTLAPSSEWWGDNIEFRFENTKPNRMLIDSPMSRLRYRVLLASSKVANSELDVKKSPNALFYIVDGEAKAKVETEQADYEFEAHDLIRSLSVDEKRAALRLFGRKGVDNMSENVVKAELLKEIRKDAKGFSSILKDKRLKTRLLAEELIDYGIISKNGYYFRNGDDTIASSTDELIDYLEDIKNQSVLLAMKNRLSKKKKA